MQLHEVLVIYIYSICLHSSFASYFVQWPKSTMYTFLLMYYCKVILSIYDPSGIHCDNSCLEVAVKIIDHFLVDKF